MSTREKERKKANKIAIIVLIVFLLLCLLGGIGYLAFQWYGGYAAEQSYGGLMEFVDDAVNAGEKDEEENLPENPIDFASLQEKNDEVYAWIEIPNTKINYPVTQSGDNEYYLNRDFYNNKTANGWVFMDYRNDSKDLDQNTIIYGHALLSGYMFGDLRETIKSYWYKNEDNLILSFSTINQEMKWEVFSIYRTPYTTDYLKTNFYDDASFLKFIDTIKERSVYNFAVPIGVEDKILTLSTCTGNDNSRLVLHAKLIK